MIQKDDKILITGATGFIGSYIARYMYSKGYTNLHATKRSKSSVKMLGSDVDKISWIETDILDVTTLSSACKGAQLVIHAAAMVSFHPHHKSAMYRTNVEGTSNVVNACIEHHVPRLLYLSSISAVGKPSNISLAIDEDTEWEANEYTSDYSKSKYLAELEVWRGKEEGLQVSILNPGVVLGAGRWDDTSLKIIKTIDKGVPFYPIGSNAFVDVRDVAKMAYMMIDQQVYGERILAISKSVKIKSLLDSIAEKIGVKAPQTALKPWMFPFASRIAKIVAFFTRQPPFITRATIMSTCEDWHYDTSKSKELLGMEYIDIEKTIEDMCDAYVESKEQIKPMALLDFES